MACGLLLEVDWQALCARLVEHLYIMRFSKGRRGNSEAAKSQSTEIDQMRVNQGGSHPLPIESCAPNAAAHLDARL